MIAQDRALIPRLLRADNLTPPSRTPWGGTRIRDALKAGLNLSQSDTRVGESWEVSVEPSFPSRMQDTNTLLSDVIGEAPAQCDQGTVKPFLEAMAGTTVRDVGRSMRVPAMLPDTTVITLMR